MRKNCAQIVCNPPEKSVDGFTQVYNHPVDSPLMRLVMWVQVSCSTLFTQPFVTSLDTGTLADFNLLKPWFSPLSTTPTTMTTIYINNKE
jgi:hypothetical protein